MNSSELFDFFRSQMADTKKPYFWSDEDIWAYMSWAYDSFVRGMGGVSDVSSDATVVDVTTGEAFAPLHRSVLRVMSAVRESDGRRLAILNNEDLPRLSPQDYGTNVNLSLTNQPGPVHSMVVGLERGKVRWINVPEADDTVTMHVYRAPLVRVTGPDQEFVDLEEVHHMSLLEGMRYLAYRKPDADTFDPRASETARQMFETLYRQAKAEWERYSTKERVTAYGGL